jgi:mono/diheme cytochrome c family protein
MKGTIPAALVALGLMSLPCLARAESRPDATAAAKGKIIYQRYCTSCHGAQARGDGPLASDLKVPPADLTQLAAANEGKFPFDRVARSIDGRLKTRGHGTPDMPVWGEVFPKTKGTESSTVESAVNRITQYLWSIQGK